MCCTTPHAHFFCSQSCSGDLTAHALTVAAPTVSDEELISAARSHSIQQTVLQAPYDHCSYRQKKHGITPYMCDALNLSVRLQEYHLPILTYT